MNKKFWVVLLALLSALCLSLGLAACGGNGGSGGGNGGTEQGGGSQGGGSDEQGGGSTGHVHTYTVDNVCSGCGDKWKYTEGLTYALNEERDTYTVMDIGTALDGVETLALVIPYGYQGKFVTAIGHWAFEAEYSGGGEYCNKLTSITIPDSVTEIGVGAFRNCSGLKSIEIPDSVTTIREATFLDCGGLASVSLPAGLTTIGASAFSGCKRLTSIEIPDSVVSIGEGAFIECSIKSIEIPHSVTSIGGYTFSYCSGLKSIEIPDSVTSIGSAAFYDCSGLTSVTIGSGVTSIGSAAFYDCNSLTSVYYKGTAEEWGNISIDDPEGGNSRLLKVTRYYFTEDEPTEEEWAAYDYYWHYDAETSLPTPWTKEEQ